ncbi:hypothetical protein FRAHR75_250027 [Frankia sp. Hr75.2]|nr:hypothetical protein FRAHR75_250027 [Frankia sp. Hr75.2]
MSGPADRAGVAVLARLGVTRVRLSAGRFTPATRRLGENSKLYI